MNIYYNPEKFGLEIFGMVETPPNYDFDMFVVWRNKADSKFLYGEDSGCSCPSPFEDKGVSDLTSATKMEVIAAAQKWASEGYRNGVDVTSLVEKVLLT